MNARSGPSDIILSGNSWVANQRVIIKIASRREFMDTHHRGGRFEKQDSGTSDGERNRAARGPTKKRWPSEPFTCNLQACKNKPNDSETK
jgi:hypothetical protein